MTFSTNTTPSGQPGTEESQKLQDSIVHALKSGYRLLDTAQGYGVEKEVGAAIKASDVPREEITLVTKFWNDAHADPAEALERSLRDLDTYVDVFLMHWPNSSTEDGVYLSKDQSPTFVETWKKMEPLVGPKCRAIGVSNFSQTTLDELLKHCTVTPSVNQVEMHALNPNTKLVPYCQSKGIHVMSWSTLGGQPAEGKTNPILNDKYFTSLAENYGVSAGVLSLSWAVQRGATVIPKSANYGRIEENIRLVELSKEDVEKMDSAGDELGKLRLADGISFGIREDPVKGTTLFGWTKQEFGWEDEKGNWLC